MFDPRLSPCANLFVFSLGPPEQSGIISTAIANAQATPPPHGNENVSLLQQEAAKNSANKTQFTFTCGSDSANKMVWPGQENGPYPQPPGAYPSSNAAPAPHPQAARARPPVRPDVPAVSTQGTQTSPRMNGTNAPPGNKNAPPPKGAQPPQQQQAPPPPKPKRSASKLYRHAANKRRMQQEYANFHSPPGSTRWICEFCEYEDIFGYKPKALIRQYERKDRQERKRLAEKRRLLEKARMKGRKGKKASKKAQNNANAQQAPNPPPGGYDRRTDEGSLDAQDDDYYDDDYDDLPPAPVPHCHHGCQHHPHPPPQKAPGIPPGDPRLGAPPIANGA